MHERKKEKKKDGKDGDAKGEVIESLRGLFQSFKAAVALIFWVSGRWKFYRKCESQPTKILMLMMMWMMIKIVMMGWGKDRHKIGEWLTFSPEKQIICQKAFISEAWPRHETLSELSQLKLSCTEAYELWCSGFIWCPSTSNSLRELCDSVLFYYHLQLMYDVSDLKLKDTPDIWAELRPVCPELEAN